MIDPPYLVEHVTINLAPVEGPGAETGEGRHKVVSLPARPFGDFVAPGKHVGAELPVVEGSDGSGAPFPLDHLELALVLLLRGVRAEVIEVGGILEPPN